jgi:hypothetical protein
MLQLTDFFLFHFISIFLQTCKPRGKLAGLTYFIGVLKTETQVSPLFFRDFDRLTILKLHVWVLYISNYMLFNILNQLVVQLQKKYGLKQHFFFETKKKSSSFVYRIHMYEHSNKVIIKPY